MMNSRTMVQNTDSKFYSDIDVLGNKPQINTFSNENGRHFAEFHFWDQNYSLNQLEVLRDTIQDSITNLNKKDVFTPMLFE